MDKRRKQLKPLRKGKSKKGKRRGCEWTRGEMRCPGLTRGARTICIHSWHTATANSQQSTYRTWSIPILPRSIISTRRPGVATSTWHPRVKSCIWAPMSAPPYTTQARTWDLYENCTTHTHTAQPLHAVIDKAQVIAIIWHVQSHGRPTVWHALTKAYITAYSSLFILMFLLPPANCQQSCLSDCWW